MYKNSEQGSTYMEKGVSCYFHSQIKKTNYHSQMYISLKNPVFYLDT